MSNRLHPAVTRHALPRHELGYELRIGTCSAVRVWPHVEGWKVTNVAASCTATTPFREQADALAERIARICAA